MPCSPLKVNRRFGGTSPSSSGSKNKTNKLPSWKQVASRENLKFCKKILLKIFGIEEWNFEKYDILSILHERGQTSKTAHIKTCLGKRVRLVGLVTLLVDSTLCQAQIKRCQGRFFNQNNGCRKLCEYYRVPSTSWKIKGSQYVVFNQDVKLII
jgi:hypothetical protein